MMTNRFHYAICLATVTLCLASCQNDDFSSGSGLSGNVVTLSGTIAGDAQSRAQIFLGNTDISTEYFLWNEGDSFSLYDLGSDGETAPLTLANFTISSSYSDDSKSASADFTGECGIADGNTVAAFYPAQSSAGSGGTVSLSIPSTSALDSNSDQEIVGYLSDYMYMYGTSTFSASGTSIVFDHLTAMIRISYTNASSGEQTVTSVSVEGDGAYFGTSSSLALVGGVNTVTGKETCLGLTFDGVTVAAGETAEFYLLFFTGDAFNSDGTLTFTVNDMSVPMETDKIQTSAFTTAYRYKFNLRQTDDALEWVNEETGYDYSVSVSYVSQSTEYGNPWVIADVTEIGTNLDYVIVSFIEGTYGGTSDSSSDGGTSAEASIAAGAVSGISQATLADVTVTETGEVTLTLSDTPETGTCTIVAIGYDDDTAVSIDTVSFEYTAPSADYSFSLSYVGQSTDYDDQYVIAEVSAFGSQVESVCIAVTDSSVSVSDAVLLIILGQLSYQEVTEEGQVTIAMDSSYATGTYTIVAVACNNGEAQNTASVTFEYTAPEADYSLGVSYVSQSTSYDSPYITAEITSYGANIDYVYWTVISGSSVSDSDITSITSVSYKSVTSAGTSTFYWSSVPDSGTYTILAVAYDNGEVVATATDTFEYTAPSATEVDGSSTGSDFSSGGSI